MPLFLTASQIAPPSFRFMVPHREKPWSAKKLEARFPHLTNALDGKSPDAFLTFFYKYNKHEQVFEFIDADCEDEFADLLGVKVRWGNDVDETETEIITSAKSLSPEELNMHKENLAMIREGLDFLAKSN